jgi:hypothetical protein
MKLFLVHGPTDQQVASNVRRELKSAGYTVRSHADIALSATDDDFMEALNSAIYDSGYVVAILSEQALKAKIVTGVLDFAAHIGKPIFALFSGDTSQTGIILPPDLIFLDELDWLDAADAPTWLSALLDATSDEFGILDGDISDDESLQRKASSAPDKEASSASPNGHFGGLSPQPALPPAPPAQPAPVTPPEERRREEAPDQWQQSEPPLTEAEASAAEGGEDAGLAFASYAPRDAAIDMWIPMTAYVYREGFESAVQADAADILGASLDDYRRNQSEALMPVAEGALIIATPTLEGFQINPPSVSIALYEAWHRFEFKIRAKTAPLNLAVNGRLTFTVEGIIVADIPLSIFVTEKPSSGQPDGTQVTAGAARPYPAIFCSYSHKDTAIVERVERAYRILGSTYLRDATTLRSGENWNQALMNMIDQADIFQLFWSTASAASKYVQQEWEYALQKRGARPAFIRPVYWQTPMPHPPDPLADIHFVYEPGLDD